MVWYCLRERRGESGTGYGAIIVAVRPHHRGVFIHPFANGNGRHALHPGRCHA
nr:Fic family protein [Mesorhizobium sp. LNHC221B00]